jgi:hypothetical protein
VWSNISGSTLNESHTVLTPDNVRCLAIFGGQLYGSASSGDYTNVFEIGFGTPTLPGETATSLKGMPVNTAASPFGFTMFAATSTASGLRTMYVADDRSVANGGGIQKWTTSDGTNWSIGATFTAAGITTGFRGIAGYASGGTVTLLASTAESSPNHLVLFVDTGSGAPTTSMVATAPSNTVYRGVAVSPHFAAP